MTVTAVRPNGKPYTRRAKPFVMTYEDFDEESWYGDAVALVMRTHDIDEAVALAGAAVARSDSGMTLPPPRLRWVRQAICMCGGGHGWDIVDDAQRGVPAVEFFDYTDRARGDWM